MKRVFVMLWDGRTGRDEQTSVYESETVKKALINAIMQYKGNYNTWDYPKDLDGIHKSNCVKGRLLYDISEDLVMYAQEA